MKAKRIYVVMKSQKTFTVTDVFGVERTISLPKGESVLPAFTTKRAALKSAEKGKFQIVIAEVIPTEERK